MADTSSTVISEAQKRAQEVNVTTINSNSLWYCIFQIAAKLTAGAFSNGGEGKLVFILSSQSFLCTSRQ